MTNDPYQISADPIWHRWVDGLIILIIGVVIGLTIALGLLLPGTMGVGQSEFRTRLTPQVESGASVEVPVGVQVEEV